GSADGGPGPEARVVKYGLVSGLILVVALAASLHRTAPAPEFPGRRVRPARESSAPTPGLSASGTAREFQAQDAAILPEAPVERTPPAPAKKPDEAPSWTRIRPLLERDLGLTPLQQER